MILNPISYRLNIRVLQRLLLVSNAKETSYTGRFMQMTLGSTWWTDDRYWIIHSYHYPHFMHCRRALEQSDEVSIRVSENGVLSLLVSDLSRSLCAIKERWLIRFFIVSTPEFKSTKLCGIHGKYTDITHQYSWLILKDCIRSYPILSLIKMMMMMRSMWAITDIIRHTKSRSI